MSKSMRYFELGLIEPLGENRYKIHHLPRLHLNHIVWNERCTCQRYKTSGKVCSHISAVKIYKKHKEEREDVKGNIK